MSMGEARLVISASDDTAKTFAAIERHAKDLGSTLKAVGTASAQLARSSAAMGDFGKVAHEVDAVAAAMAKASKAAPGLKGPAEALGRYATEAAGRMRTLESEAQRVAQATNRLEMFRSLQPGLARVRTEFASAKAAVLDLARGMDVADRSAAKFRTDLAAAKLTADRHQAAMTAARPSRADAADPVLFKTKQDAHTEAMRLHGEAVADVNRLRSAVVTAEAERDAMSRKLAPAQANVSRAAEALDREKTAAMALKREVESVIGPMTTLAGAEAKLKAQADGTASAMEHQAAATKRAGADARRTMELRERAGAHHAPPASVSHGGGHGGHGDETLMGLAGLYVAHSFGHQAAETVETYREFDKERRYGKVVMGISDEDQKPLVDQAVRGGAETRFNDIQWLESQRELAARGYNKEQVMAFAPVAAQIAQALDVSMPEGVKALEGAMLGFKKDTSTFEKAQAAATRTADLQVKTSKISGMGFEDIQALYKYGAAPAQMAGLSEEKMLAFGAILKKSNMNGDESGTAFRALGKNLLAPTHEAQIGLSAAGVDYSKYQKMPDELYLPGFVNTVAKEYGIKLDQKAQGAIGKIFKNKELIADAGKFLPAVQGVLSDVLGGDDAKSKNKIAGLARRYRDDSSKGINTDQFFEDMMGAVSKNKTLANAIFGSKQGGRIYSALGDPEFFHQFVEMLKEHSDGYAKKVSEARMEGFNGELQKLQGSVLNVRSAIGRAWDDDGNGSGGLATQAVARLAQFTQAVAEAPPRVLQLGTAAMAAGAAFVGLKGIGLLKGGFGLNASALALDRAAGHLMMVGGGPGGIASRIGPGGVVAAGGAVAEGIAIPAIAEAAAAAVAIMGAAAVAKLVKASAEAQEPGKGGQWSAPTPGTEDLDQQRLKDQDDRALELEHQISRNKALEKLPGTSDTVNAPLQAELDQLNGQRRLLRDRLANLYVSPDREAEHGKAFMAMRRPEEFGPDMPEGWQPPSHKLEINGPNLPPSPQGPAAAPVPDKSFAAKLWDFLPSWSRRDQQGPSTPLHMAPEPLGPPMPVTSQAPVLGRVPALPSEGGPVPVHVVSSSVDPKSMPGGITPAGVTRDFTLGNRTGNFTSPGLGTDGTFSPFPGHHAPGFTPAEAHAAPPGDIAGILSGLKATVDGPITAQVSGQAEVAVTVKVEAGSSLISAAATASQAKASMSLTSGTGSSGGTGLQRTFQKPGTGQTWGAGHR